MNNKLLVSVLVALTVVAVLVSYSLGAKAVKPFGSVNQGEGYQATTTPLGVSNINLLRGSATVGAGSFPGMLGSVVVYGPNAGFCLYDATTTDITKRTGGIATTTITLFCLPTSATSTTYTLDQSFSTGLLFVGSGATTATSTITWK